MPESQPTSSMPVSRAPTSATSPENGEVAGMIDAEVNEGGPPSSLHSDTPVEGPGSLATERGLAETTPLVEACPAPDRVLHLPLGKALSFTQSATLMKAAGLDLIRLVIPAGTVIPPHKAPGEITVQCMEGHVAVEHDGRAVELHVGDLLYLCPQEIHSLRGLADSSVLVTRLRPHANDPNDPSRT